MIRNIVWFVALVLLCCASGLTIISILHLIIDRKTR